MLDQHLMVLEHRIDRRAGRVGEAVEPLRLPIMRSRVGMASSAMTMPLRGKRKKEKVALVAVMHKMLTRLNATQSRSGWRHCRRMRGGRRRLAKLAPEAFCDPANAGVHG